MRVRAGRRRASAGAATLLLVAAGCGGGAGQSASPFRPAPRGAEDAPRVDEVARGPVRRAGHVGVVIRESRVVVEAPFSARLLDLGVQPGDTVAEGSALARFDASSVDRVLEVAEAAVREAEAAFSVATVEAEQAEARRRRRESRGELFSTEQLEEVRTEVEVARARLHSAEAGRASARVEADQARADRDRATVVAPMSGVVDAVYGVVGGQAERGDPLMAIEAGDFHVRFAAAPSEAEDLRAGRWVEVWAEGSEPIMGVVIYTSPELDPRTLLLTFDALLCGGRLPAGTPVRVLAADPEALVAPDDATGCAEATASLTAEP